MKRNRKTEVLCEACDGTGRIGVRNKETRARKAANVGYLKSPDRMAKMGRTGGRPRALTLTDLDAREERPLKEVAP